MTTMTNWPAPGTPPLHPAPMRRWFHLDGRKVAIVIGGMFLFLFAAAAVLVVTYDGTTGGSKTGGSFYAAPGWTINRVADLAIKIEYDDGVSRSRADCAMKAIVGVTTWLEWQSLSSASQLAVIRGAEAAC